jgi:hypothetical protein
VIRCAGGSSGSRTISSSSRAAHRRRWLTSWLRETARTTRTSRSSRSATRSLPMGTPRRRSRVCARSRVGKLLRSRPTRPAVPTSAPRRVCSSRGVSPMGIRRRRVAASIAFARSRARSPVRQRPRPKSRSRRSKRCTRMSRAARTSAPSRCVWTRFFACWTTRRRAPAAPRSRISLRRDYSRR